MNTSSVSKYKTGLSMTILSMLLISFSFTAFSQEEPREEAISFSSFELIVQRNIFDPNREQAQVEEPTPEAPPEKDEISLVGTIVTETQRFAFFDGSSSAYRRVLPLGAEIDEGVIQAIEVSHIDVQLGDEMITIPVGKGLVREEGEEWRLQDAPRRIESNRDNERTREQPTPANDLLRRLMERRNQERGE